MTIHWLDQSIYFNSDKMIGTFIYCLDNLDCLLCKAIWSDLIIFTDTAICAHVKVELLNVGHASCARQLYCLLYLVLVRKMNNNSSVA